MKLDTWLQILDRLAKLLPVAAAYFAGKQAEKTDQLEKDARHAEAAAHILKAQRDNPIRTVADADRLFDELDKKN